MVNLFHHRAEPAAQNPRSDSARPNVTGAVAAETNLPRSSFADLFEHATAPAAPKAPAMQTPAYEDVRVFNANGSFSSSNPLEFATPRTADEMAKKLGGQVKEAIFAGSQFSRSNPELLIVGAGANPVNAGLVADLFEKYGDAPGSQAWKVINRDLGRPENSTTPVVVT